ncbi:MAG TPA: hypothetical protein VEF76_07770 [Patescibacteria group bacterium]|nr:hypothetical protein [Patescibacteria group bacterium]
MSAENVKSLELEAFKRKLANLAALQENSDPDFAEAIYIALTRFGVSETQFRDTFGLTKGAVERWTTQKNLPQKDVRPKILEWILQTL